MTASEKYALLEAEAAYFDGQSARGRTVRVRFGQNSLTLHDAQGRPEVSWPLATLRRLPGTRKGDRDLRLLPDFEATERLVIEDKAMHEALEEVCPGLDARQPSTPGIKRKLAVWGLTAVSSVLLIVFVIAPLLADTIAEMLPVESEIALGKSIADEIVDEGIFFADVEPGACETDLGRAALDKMVAALEPVANSHVPLTVRVLDSTMPNAFALPGGQIFFLDALFEEAGSPEEVAGVLAHEIGHVVGRDSTRNVLRTLGTSGIISLLIGDFVGGFAAVAIAEAAIDASYSRSAESIADQTALRLLREAGIPSAPLGDFFKRLQEAYGNSDSYLSSHPANSDREQVFRLAPQPEQTVSLLTDEEWEALKGICG